MRSHVTASSAGSTQCQAAGLRRGQALLASLVVLAGALALFAAKSSAAVTRDAEPFSPITGSGSGLSLKDPSGLALDEASGNVFVVDDEHPGASFIDVLGAEGGAPVGLVGPYRINGPLTASTNATGIAVDNAATSPSKGTLYARGEGANIVKFVRNPLTEKYELAGELTASSPGLNPSGETGATVDTRGNLYWGYTDYQSDSLFRFSPAGTQTASYRFEASIGNYVTGIAVDTAGDVFTVNAGGQTLYKYPANPSGEITPTNFTKVVTGVRGVAIDPGTNTLYVLFSNHIAQYDATTLEKGLEFGSDELGHSLTKGIAVNSVTERIYVGEVLGNGESNVIVFGPTIIAPTPHVVGASNITGTKATLNGSVDPEGFAVEECFFEWGATTSYGNIAPCEELPTSESETQGVSANISGLTPNEVTYHYRLVARNENGYERSADKTLLSGKTVITEAATGVGTSTATLRGTVRPEGLAYSDCQFEYKLTTDADFEKAPCVPPAESIDADFSGHAVSAVLTKLQSNSTYEFRLTATNAKGTLSGEVLTFTTVGPPQITEVRALNASQSAANIEGKINPSSFGTSYRFEWGPTASYGNQVPADFEPFIGSGNEPVRVSAKLNGLSAGQIYHYRIVASSSAGTTATPDQILETLNSCGLPEGRCFELVSRREAGPVAIPAQFASPAELHFQAATTPGSLAYFVEAGYPDATKGAEVLYRGTRGSSGWESTQLSNPFVAPNEQNGPESGSGNTKFLSNDLTCGFLESPQPLTDDPSTRLAIESGGTNLYRINPDSSYTAVSKLAPENPEDHLGRNNYEVDWAAQDCSKVLFESSYHYPDIAGKEIIASGGVRLYEWDEGTLRNVGVVPGPSGEEVVVEATGGSRSNTQNTVSEDGSRVFFTAPRQTSPAPEEIGKKAIFVREDGGSVRDLSLSQTAIPDKGATYQWATPNGAHVFFTANAGLTDDSSPEGTDLYEYNLETEELVDRSASQVEGGAQVAGFVGAAEDGSQAYFISRARLVPGRGRTLAQNQSAHTYSVYGESSGEISFVGAIGEDELSRVVLGGLDQRSWSSRVSPDGRYLLFVSSANVTGYVSGGSWEAYLYDAQGGSEDVICISCRQDEQPSVGPEGYEVLSKGEAINNPTHPVRSLVMHEGEPQVFFNSPDVLAPGAAEGQNNVYEWVHGQVFRLASASEGQAETPLSGFGAAFAGASDDGSDVYFFTPGKINWEDGDERLSVYDARVGGGFPEPPAPPVPCEATSEGSGSCQGPAQAGPALSGAASAAFNGPGNPPDQSTKKKSKKKPHKKKQKHAKKKGKGKKQARNANGNRRAGK